MLTIRIMRLTLSARFIWKVNGFPYWKCFHIQIIELNKTINNYAYLQQYYVPCTYLFHIHVVQPETARRRVYFVQMYYFFFFQNYNKPTVYADVGQSRCRFMAYLPYLPATSSRVPTPDVHRTDYPVYPFYRYTLWRGRRIYIHVYMP